MNTDDLTLTDLLTSVRACEHCKEQLPFAPRPVVRAQSSARLLIIGQAPGTKVHASGIPWDDASGKRLREWLQMTPEQFYDAAEVAIMPMGLCYPGKGKSGDLPPRTECAPRWHKPLLDLLPNVEQILLIGQYAQNYYLPADFLKKYKTLTERVRHWQEVPAPYFVLPHPSPRNQLWLKKNPWFDETVVPALRARLANHYPPADPGNE
ncbi:uracil-DNA glycosylase family protein [Oceanobacter mangrovi]|uniref:uracil-DNA glycosylase family protein n=1 Tax=Oceanobacter mangrovi TaxID=2862510 RepID=UPI001C8EA44F|nr:uracil-DNA glycosylase family protein [Oceanobacter mangrovi]